ncbi:MAG: hypothetical protein Q8L87_12160 [Anaerolineales bacterium]|jgi:hypothetical protein|nr:hypothetical protein [Anaerolineales bacterium]
MLPLVDFPELAQHYAPFFEDVFSGAAFVEFQRYISGLIVSENKTVEGINRLFVNESRNQSSLNRLLTVNPFSLQELNQKRHARPQRNGSVENFNGRFQPRLFQRHFTRVSALKRELQRLQETVNSQHVQRKLGGLTPEQYRRRKKLQILPPRFVVPTETLPIAAGRVIFIRQVTIHGKIHLLSQTFNVGKRLKGQYVKVVLDTQRARLTVYVKARIFKRWAYPFLKR